MVALRPVGVDPLAVYSALRRRIRAHEDDNGTHDDEVGTHDDEVGTMTGDHENQRRELAQRLLEILELEAIERNLYRGGNETREGVRLFGGQVLAQALRAACRTVEERRPHSLRAYFMRAGNSARPVLYEVERIRDGRSFTTRRVVAIQQGKAIFSMDVSLQVAEDGFDHAHPMPNVPPPEELEDDMAVVARLPQRDPGMSPMAGRPRPFEMRSVFPLGSDAWRLERFWNPVWIRFAAEIDPNDGALAHCLLAYASDMGMVSTAALPHAQRQTREALQMASLDHALWIHRPVPVGEWLLFHKRTSAAQGARGLVHAEFFSRDGALIASVTQEGLMRTHRGAIK
ncbi:MAG: acyl-CoA thioesterase II [Pseudomonadales bacterium]